MAANDAVKNPWFKNQPLPSPSQDCSLQNVMDEELARVLQRGEDNPTQFQHGNINLVDQVNPTCESDHILAQMLQNQYDFEYDQSLELEERKMNGNNGKVTISYDNYRCMHPLDKEYYYTTATDETYNDNEDKTDTKLPKKNTITTKHDYDICCRKNTKSMESKFPPNFRCGDLNDASTEVKIPNHVYNSLKQHSFREDRQSHRLHEKKEHSTHEQALDEKTRLLIYKLVNNGTLENVGGCFSTGKEACVFYATGGQLEKIDLPAECAIKVYKTTLNEFKNRDEYIKDDYRFKDRFSKQNPRKIVRLWAEKETHNLHRLQAASIHCPQPLLLRKHVLVMSFIGLNQKPAPKLKDAKLSYSDITAAYNQCLQAMKTMYHKAKLIHADLSEYNILWHESKIWIIDVSQAVDRSHPKWAEFLLRDCRNISRFFEQRLTNDVKTPMEIFNFVTELNISANSEEEFLQMVRTLEYISS
ncbi:uncharacterized protein TRIADDRAFT_28003 [Trichoplax adhaerens]|uniref:Serine/threonine-protein kinase RIO3 n=1 Tax=Trichoplax adhaerens TaxID=10228 RepID=B3S1Y2_TRIAD|nr:hypothetical protein TRIADDRAFT_28003 [Trichoplax adhaerens]EDV23270.1 hypothetical protein TRIADDRAFT_28003 [Trichoplax adhaerens]|eukprot:XP_002114180.1 hypothetical protein TRIADDRAFT_28003 [Trichoplax adhaerens]